MRKFIALISVLILCFMALISCGGKDDAPEGLQVVKISKPLVFSAKAFNSA